MRDEKAYFYDTIADDFDQISNTYDTNRRIEIVIDELLAGVDLQNQSVLDVGCGTGRFTQRAGARGARMTSLDIGVRLLDLTRRRCRTSPVAADACALPFGSNTFDVVISSECIEHTRDPEAALLEIHRVTKPGGTFVVTVPNQAWHFAITIANALKLRPYEGYENWMRWSAMRSTLRRAGAHIDEMRGFHLVPFVVPGLPPLLRRMDRFGRTLGPLMLNIAVRATKSPSVAS